MRVLVKKKEIIKVTIPPDLAIPKVPPAPITKVPTYHTPQPETIFPKINIPPNLAAPNLRPLPPTKVPTYRPPQPKTVHPKKTFLPKKEEEE